MDWLVKGVDRAAPRARRVDRRAERRSAPPGTRLQPVPAVALRGITKRFPGVVANDGVDFEAAEGEVHALLGENGAGKCTLSNILTGLYRPDEGEILLYGEPVARSRRRATRSTRGSAWCTSTSGSSPPFTVAENVMLGDHRGEGRKFLVAPAPHRAARRRARRALRDRRRPAGAHLAALARRAAARRDPEGALPRGADPDPRRADRGADAAGGRVAVRDAARDGGRGPHGDLHLAQAARGEGGLRPRDGAARRQDGRDRRRPRDATPRSLAALMVGREVDASRRVDRARRPLGEPVLERRRPLGATATAAATRSAASRSTRARGRDRRRRGRRRQRPARARRDDHRHARRRPRGTVRGRRAAAAAAATRARRSARASRTCRRTGCTPASRRALRSRRTSCSSRYRGREVSPGPLLRLGAIRERAVGADRALRRARRRAASCPRASSRAATCRRSCWRASSRARRACSSPRRRRAASTSPRSRRCTATCARRPPRRRRAADQRGPRRDPRARRPHRRHVRGRASPASVDAGERRPSRSSAC